MDIVFLQAAAVGSLAVSCKEVQRLWDQFKYEDFKFRACMFQVEAPPQVDRSTIFFVPKEAAGTLLGPLSCC
ncbi:hypothetical protein TNCV_2491391 [Trichonephila clavipes]|nr:hypothetical protein TNCV_2491391 [Trichonephila clavipes]